MLYYDQTTSTALWIGRSTDGGKSFAPPVKVADVHRPPSPLPTSKFRTFVLPALAINPQDGTLAATWNDYVDNSDILLATSRDNAAPGVRPRASTGHGTADQFFPSRRLRARTACCTSPGSTAATTRAT